MTTPVEQITQSPTPPQLLAKVNELSTSYNALAVFCQYVQNALLTAVTGNPFTVTFDTLDGLTATGNWNQSQDRIEF